MEEGHSTFMLSPANFRFHCHAGVTHAFTRRSALLHGHVHRAAGLIAATKMFF